MKTIKLKLALVVLFAVTSVQAVEKQRRSLVIAGDYWCPYNCNPESENQGFLVELARRALYIYGIDVDYRMMSWSRALEEVGSGKIDGIIGLSNPKGKKLVSTELPLDYSSSAAFTRADTDWVYDGISSLRGRKIGIIMDYLVDESINQYIGSNYTTNPGMFVVEDGTSAVIESIANLMDNEIDVYIEDERVVKYYTQETGLAKSIRNAGKITKEKLPIYIAFSQDIPNIKKYIGYLEEGIASLKATGEYDDLRTKYNMDR